MEIENYLKIISKYMYIIQLYGKNRWKAKKTELRS